MFKQLLSVIGLLLAAFLLHHLIELLLFGFPEHDILELSISLIVSSVVYFCIGIFTKTFYNKNRTHFKICILIVVVFLLAQIEYTYQNPYFSCASIFFWWACWLWAFWVGFFIKRKWYFILLSLTTFFLFPITIVYLYELLYLIDDDTKVLPKDTMKIHNQIMLPFALPTLRQTVLTNDSINKQIVVAIFWKQYDIIVASVFDNLYEHYKTNPDIKFVMIDVAYQHTWESSKEFYTTPFIRGYNRTFPSYYLKTPIQIVHDRKAKLTRQLGLRGLPLLAIINKGVLVETFDCAYLTPYKASLFIIQRIDNQIIANKQKF